MAAEKGSSMIFGMRKYPIFERTWEQLACVEGQPSSAISILKIKGFCLNCDDIDRTINE